MKVTFISPYSDITAFGMRTMSAYLKQHGHKTQMIFMPDPFDRNQLYRVKRYQDNILDELITLCNSSDLIGITLMTNFFGNAVQITARLKEALEIPVIWGGVHPTIRPDESLEYADMICIGDGEDAILDLVNKMADGDDYFNIANLWVKWNGSIIKNAVRPLPRDVDIYPFPDYSLEDHHILFEGHIRPLTPEITKLCLTRDKQIGYETMTSRGCPHKCTYCINDTIKNLYDGQGYLRWRSIEHVIGELLWVKENMPYVDHVFFSDDSFFAHSLKNLEAFCREYKEKIGLPFFCLGSPLTVTEEKIKLLVDAGLKSMQLGIESGSRTMQELFNRKNMSNKVMMEAIKTINKYKDKMFPPRYDFILDTPYETDEDKIESVRFIAEIPKPFRLQLFSLVLYPGTKLYQMAKADGFIKDDRLEIYCKGALMREHNYFNLLMSLAKGGRFPSPLLKFMVKKHVVRILNSKPMKPFFKYLDIMVRRGLHFIKKPLRRE